MRAYEGAVSPHKILILITDGENHEGDPAQDAAKAKKEKNIHIYTIGIGTPEGELVPLKDDSGAISFAKDKEGLVIKSRLEETLLQKISEVSDGRYVRATPTEFGLDLLYEKPLAAFEKKVYENKSIAIRQERYQLFLAIAYLLFLLETLLAQNTSRRHD
jgi:Ca-activated chloride channel family protein